MSCTSHFMNFEWEHHPWRRRVVASEVRTGRETNMWARAVDRDYVRCDKDEVCDTCGKVRHTESCICDMERGERCALRREFLGQPRA